MVHGIPRWPAFAEMTIISQPAIDLHQKSGRYFIATSKLTERIAGAR
jgi:hypothetical protein